MCLTIYWRLKEISDIDRCNAVLDVFRLDSFLVSVLKSSATRRTVKHRCPATRHPHTWHRVCLLVYSVQYKLESLSLSVVSNRRNDVFVIIEKTRENTWMGDFVSKLGDHCKPVLNFCLVSSFLVSHKSDSNLEVNVCVPVCLSFCLSFCLSVCLTGWLFVYLSV